MANLLQQTEQILARHDKTWSDIYWIGIPDGSEMFWKPDAYGTVSIEEFKQMADRIYDDGFGGAEVNMHLIIAGWERDLKEKKMIGGWNEGNTMDPMG